MNPSHCKSGKFMAASITRLSVEALLISGSYRLVNPKSEITAKLVMKEKEGLKDDLRIAFHTEAQISKAAFSFRY